MWACGSEIHIVESAVLAVAPRAMFVEPLEATVICWRTQENSASSWVSAEGPAARTPPRDTQLWNIPWDLSVSARGHQHTEPLGSSMPHGLCSVRVPNVTLCCVATVLVMSEGCLFRHMNTGRSPLGWGVMAALRRMQLGAVPLPIVGGHRAFIS